MGYYTTHRLTVAPPLPLKKVAKAFVGYEDMIEEIEPGVFGSDEPLKWYDHERDMRAFSGKYPKHLFTLDGEGEEQGDVWREYCQAEGGAGSERDRPPRHAAGAR